MSSRYDKKWDGPRSTRKYLQESWASRSWLTRALLILIVLVWGGAAFAIFANHQPAGAAIGLPILLTVVALIVIGLDYARDAIMKAVYLDGVDARRERAVQHEEKQELHKHGVNPEKIEQKLKHGQSFHLNSDGEIVVDKQAKHK